MNSPDAWLILNMRHQKKLSSIVYGQQFLHKYRCNNLRRNLNHMKTFSQTMTGAILDECRAHFRIFIWLIWFEIMLKLAREFEFLYYLSYYSCRLDQAYCRLYNQQIWPKNHWCHPVTSSTQTWKEQGPIWSGNMKPNFYN